MTPALGCLSRCARVHCFLYDAYHSLDRTDNNHHDLGYLPIGTIPLSSQRNSWFMS